MYNNPATKPFFRLLAPLAFGSIVYLLVLLAFGTHGRVLEDFFNQELGVCVGMSYLVLEGNRLVAVLFHRQQQYFWLRTLLKVLLALLVTQLFTLLSLMLYFQYALGISNLLSYFTELKVFSLIFLFIALLYQGYFSGFNWLHYQFQQKINTEISRRQELDQQIYAFCHTLHPDFLFSSLEHIILSLREQQPEKADEGIVLLAELYRYFLHQRQELVPLQEELLQLDKLHQLLLQSGKHVELHPVLEDKHALLSPACLLRVVEAIARTQLSSATAPLVLQLVQQEARLVLTFAANPSLSSTHSLPQLLENLQQHYGTLTNSQLSWQSGTTFTIQVPTATLLLHESYYC